METTTRPEASADDSVIAELSADVTSEADQQILNGWEHELAVQNLGKEVIKMLPDGTLATEADIQAVRDAGQDMSHPYGNAARR